jgi:hypothetical protein
MSSQRLPEHGPQHLRGINHLVAFTSATISLIEDSTLSDQVTVPVG